MGKNKNIIDVLPVPKKCRYCGHSDKIYRLKKDGYNIKSEQIKVKRADGTDAYVTKYILEE